MKMLKNTIITISPIFPPQLPTGVDIFSSWMSSKLGIDLRIGRIDSLKYEKIPLDSSSSLAI